MCNLFGVAGKVDRLVIIRMDIKILNTRAKMVHQLSQSSRAHGPMVGCLFRIEDCMDRRGDFKRQAIFCGHTWVPHVSIILSKRTTLITYRSCTEF